jgi:hypothetical protein
MQTQLNRFSKNVLEVINVWDCRSSITLTVSTYYTYYTKKCAIVKYWLSIILNGDHERYRYIAHTYLRNCAFTDVSHHRNGSCQVRKILICVGQMQGWENDTSNVRCHIFISNLQHVLVDVCTQDWHTVMLSMLYRLYKLSLCQ